MRLRIPTAASYRAMAKAAFGLYVPTRAQESRRQDANFLHKRAVASADEMPCKIAQSACRELSDKKRLPQKSDLDNR
jgi:hypothetical protein